MLHSNINYLVRSQDGDPMFYCDRKKFNWYLKKNLAKLIGDKEAQLTFEPNGPGHANDVYLLSPKDFQCVVCGCTNNLSKHHVVPYLYRKLMPDNVKSHNPYDIILVCTECHRKYELESNKLRSRLEHFFRVPYHDPRVYLLAYTLTFYRQHKTKKQIDMMMQEIAQLTGRHPTEEDIDKFSKMSTMRKDMSKRSAQYVVDRVDIQRFFVLWRKHFVMVMKPKYMSPYWELERSAYVDSA